jgi:hypothetical protein
MRFSLICLLGLSVLHLSAAEPYKSPYSVKFSFPEEELIGDLLKGPRSDWKDHATVPFREWDNPANQTRWGYWGPSMKQFDPPAGLAKKTPQWSRARASDRHGTAIRRLQLPAPSSAGLGTARRLAA